MAQVGGVRVAAALDGVEATLTSREREVYGRIRRGCASRPDGTVAAQLIGSAGASRSLIRKGLIVEEVEGVGRQGGVYLRYRLCEPVGPDECAVAGPLPLTSGYPHGVHGSYTNHGCRCRLCTEAHALALAGYRAVRSQVSARQGRPVVDARAEAPRQPSVPHAAEMSDGLQAAASAEAADPCGPGPERGFETGRDLTTQPEPADTPAGPALGRGGLRRPPKQARAGERLERMLDAAERVFVDVGVQAATTTLIAAEAETSVGSVYHFFTDKQAVVEALAARYLTALRAALHDQGGEALGGIVDTIADLAERHPGLGPLLQRSSRADPDDPSLEINTVLTDHLYGLLTVHHSQTGTARRRTVAVMCASLLRCQLEMLSTRPPNQRAVIVAETRLALIAYATSKSEDDSTRHQGPRRNPARRNLERPPPSP